MNYIDSAVICVLNGERTKYVTGAQAMKVITEKYCVESISAEENEAVVDLKLDTIVRNNQNADWVKEYIESTIKRQNCSKKFFECR